jgi:hypothetical protein
MTAQRFTYADGDLGPRAKFDIQLGSALNDQDQFAARLQNANIELKTERFQWEQTGNICIEYAWDGKPSGIAATPADFWVHELARGDATLLYLMIPVPHLKQICREAYAAGNYRKGVGDGGHSDVILLKIKDLLKVAACLPDQ